MSLWYWLNFVSQTDQIVIQICVRLISDTVPTQEKVPKL
jgi:hypothetical protein